MQVVVPVARVVRFEASPANAIQLIQVARDGLLARAGVRTGDLVTAIDGVEIETFAAGKKAFYGKRPGPTRLTVLRNGRPFRIEVDLRPVTAGTERSGATLRPGLR